MIDIVGAKTSAHQLLEQVGFFIAALGRTKAGQAGATQLTFDLVKPATGKFHRLFPAGFTEHLRRVACIEVFI